MKGKLRQRKWAGLLPTSGEVLGGIARLIDWEPKRSARERTWRKFCGGEHISKETRRAIIEEMVEAVIYAGVGGRPPEGGAPDYSPLVEALSQLVMDNATWWDDICAQLTAALPMEPTVFTSMAALRLLSVDLAMRFGSAMLHRGVALELPPAESQPTPDIGELLLPRVLSQTIQEAGITRVALADALEVSKEAVDQWLKFGALIRPELIEDIAELVSEKRGGDVDALSMELRVNREGTRMLMPLVDVVGTGGLSQLITGLIRLTEACRSALVSHLVMLDEAERNFAISTVMLRGGACRLAPMLREAMLAEAPDETWRDAIAASPDQWGPYLAAVFTSQMSASREQSTG